MTMKPNARLLVGILAAAIFFGAVLAFPFAVSAQDSSFWDPKNGLVPCGNPGQSPCTLCDFATLLNILIKFAIYGLALPIAGLMFIYSGFLFALSGGNPSRIESAKKVLTNTITGLIIMLIAFFVVDTLIKTLVAKSGGANFNTVLKNLGPWNDPFKSDAGCKAFLMSAGDQKPAPGAPVTPPPTMPPPKGPISKGPSNISDASARSQVESAGIKVNKLDCAFGQQSNCTSLKGIQPTTLQAVIILKALCQCEMTITGGTEPGHSLNGELRHDNGYKLDFALLPGFTKWIEVTWTRVPTNRTDVSAAYAGPGGINCARENDHWDCTF